MGVFKSADEVYDSIGALFHEVKSGDIAQKISASGLIIQFKYSDPDSVITIDGKNDPSEEGCHLNVHTGECDLKADVTLSMKADLAHKFWFGKVNLPVQLQIPAEQLTFLPTQDGFAAQLELRVAVLDEQGSTAEIPVLPFTIQSNRLPTAGSRAPYETNIRIRKRKHDIVFSLYDLASGQILSTRVEVDP